MKNRVIIHLLAFFCFIFCTISGSAVAQENSSSGYTSGQSGYANVNGLKMYYEIHGNGEPLVLLHGAYMTIEGPIREMANSFSKNRKIIAVELQGHGRTADVDKPLTCQQMADDVAGLLKHLKINKADVFGYSMGGGVTLQLAIRHPELVRKIVAASASYHSDGIYPELLEMLPSMTPEMFEGTPWKAMYDSLSPHPEKFPTLMAKLKVMDQTALDWEASSIKGIKAPTLLVLGDSDITKPEHAIEMFRLLGGGVMGDIVGLPNSQLAILPGTTHIGLMDKPAWLNPMIEAFLSEPEKISQH